MTDLPHTIVIDGQRYTRTDDSEAAYLGDRLRTFTVEGSEFFRELFIKIDTSADGSRFGMYSDGDELRPFFTEAFLYNLLGKDEARSVLAIMRRLCVLAGVNFR